MLSTKLLAFTGACLLSLGCAYKVQAATIFSDNFNSENGGVGALNYSGFKNFTVTDGTVDLIGNNLYDLYPGNGLYVDLDGTSGQAGVLTTKQSFNLTPGTYNLKFSLGGSQRGDTNIVDVSLGSVFSKTYTLASSDPLTPITEALTVSSPTTASLSFHNRGGDYLGAILDNVSLSNSSTASVPESSPALGIIAFASFLLVFRLKAGHRYL